MSEGQLVRAITSADLSSSQRRRSMDDDYDDSDSDASVHENIVTRTSGRAGHMSVDISESPALSEQDFYPDGLLPSVAVLMLLLSYTCLFVCLCVCVCV